MAVSKQRLLGMQLFMVTLKLEAEYLSDIFPLVVTQQDQVGLTVPQVVHEGVEDYVQDAVRVKVEEAD